MYALKRVETGVKLRIGCDNTDGDSLLMDAKGANVMNILAGSTDRWVDGSNLPVDHPPRSEFGVNQGWGGRVITRRWLL